MKTAKSSIPENFSKVFPRRESFIDASGSLRNFKITIKFHDPGYVISAIEIVSASDGYEFDVYTDGNPLFALGDLRGKIKKGLAIRYLHEDRHGIHMSHDAMRGRISSGGIVVDGKKLDYDSFIGILCSHEGFNISIKISDSSD